MKVVALVIGIIILIGLEVFLSILAYGKGKASGDKTISLILIIIGIFTGGIVFVPGICHLIGTTKNPNYLIDRNLSVEEKALKVQNLKMENELLKKKTQKENKKKIVDKKSK